jgi:hypothetical protein
VSKASRVVADRIDVESDDIFFNMIHKTFEGRGKLYD